MAASAGSSVADRDRRALPCAGPVLDAVTPAHRRLVPGRAVADRDHVRDATLRRPRRTPPRRRTTQPAVLQPFHVGGRADADHDDVGAAARRPSASRTAGDPVGARQPGHRDAAQQARAVRLVQPRHDGAEPFARAARPAASARPRPPSRRVPKCDCRRGDLGSDEAGADHDQPRTGPQLVAQRDGVARGCAARARRRDPRRLARSGPGPRSRPRRRRRAIGGPVVESHGPRGRDRVRSRAPRGATGPQVVVSDSSARSSARDVTGQELLRQRRPVVGPAGARRRSRSSSPSKPWARSARAADSPASEAPTTAMRFTCSALPAPLVVTPGGRLGAASSRTTLIIPVDDHHLVRAHRQLGRRRVDRAGAQVETRSVQRAFDLAALEPAVGQRGVLVRAGVVDGEHLAVVGVEHRDRRVQVRHVAPPRGAGLRAGRFRA